MSEVERWERVSGDVPALWSPMLALLQDWKGSEACLPFLELLRRQRDVLVDDGLDQRPALLRRQHRVQRSDGCCRTLGVQLWHALSLCAAGLCSAQQDVDLQTLC